MPPLPKILDTALTALMVLGLVVLLVLGESFFIARPPFYALAKFWTGEPFVWSNALGLTGYPSTSARARPEPMPPWTHLR